MDIENKKIAVIGLGYVGLPIAIEFSSKFVVVGFDIDQTRIDELNSGVDITLEFTPKQLAAASIQFSSEKEKIVDSDVYIVTVPTPINENKEPDLSYLKSASTIVGQAITNGDVVIYESTVYPGATEEFCVPILERESNLVLNQDFYCGYSPERINPGDQTRSIRNVIKLTSGSNEEAADFVDKLYSKIIDAGTFKTSSIKIAEAAKVIENTQRDINIALVNELAVIFSNLDIDTHQVLNAAATKWNFQNYIPGLVGGHCIGIDPYYLTYKSIQAGYEPQMILAGRKLNDGMAYFVGDRLVKFMTDKNININGSNILIMGMTFKENCPDYRNSKVIDLIKYIEKHKGNVQVYEPFLDSEEINEELNIRLVEDIPINYFDAIVISVAHEIFVELGIARIKQFSKEHSIIFDFKNLFPDEPTLKRL